MNWGQPPSGGCVLKHTETNFVERFISQPPSGGCVLKLHCAALTVTQDCQPPSGGCVLKRFNLTGVGLTAAPAAFRRLCVETEYPWIQLIIKQTSRLQAAVC